MSIKKDTVARDHVEVTVGFRSAYTTDTYVFYAENEMQIAEFLLKQHGFWSHMKSITTPTGHTLRELLQFSENAVAPLAFQFIHATYHRVIHQSTIYYRAPRKKKSFMRLRELLGLTQRE